MKGFLVLVCVGLLMVGVTHTASAAVYRCDKNGGIVYSAHPCGKDAVKLDASNPKSSITVMSMSVPKPATVKQSGSKHAQKANQHACPVDSLSSIELRNLRVSHVIMVCESAEGVRATWGKPDVITRTVSKGHVRERWVYNGPRGKPARSVSLEDGKVTSFKD